MPEITDFDREHTLRVETEPLSPDFEDEDNDLYEDIDEAPLTDGNETSTYEELKTLGMLCRKKGDRSSWVLCDITGRVVNLAERAKDRIRWAREAGDSPGEEDVSLAKEYKDILKTFANDVAITYDHVLYHYRVGSVFPKGHLIRRSRLTFSHARALYTIESHEERETMVRMALNENLSVKALRDFVGAQKRSTAMSEGMYTCFRCTERITAEDLVVVKKGKQSLMFHSWGCAAIYCNDQATIVRETQLIEQLEVPELLEPIGDITDADLEFLEI